ncbi:MAG: hypothetical protein JW875_04230 [Spirochaetales bacterium]|nr:hypothetical protein [Spirochaetales bacterium]
MDAALTLSSLSQLELRHTVCVRTQRMALDATKASGELVLKMMDDVDTITDEALGKQINVQV